MKTPQINDATLREGKQSIPRELLHKDILDIAEKIIAIGVDQLEVGHAAISSGEVKMLQAIKRKFPATSLMTHARATANDVARAVDAGVDWVGIFVSTNEYAKFRINNFSIEKIKERVHESIELAKANQLKVRFTIEDCSRTNMDLMLMVYENAIQWGADRICFADTLGILEPKEVAKVVRVLQQHTNTPLEVHFHNDRGLAMANTLEAIELGVQWISSSINGIGERAGITDTCLLLANLHYKAIRSLVPTITIKEVSDFVAATLQSPVDEHRPATGQKIFSHVADLHVKAMKKNASAYNWIDPELLGHQTALIEPVAPKEIINQFSKKVV